MLILQHNLFRYALEQELRSDAINKSDDWVVTNIRTLMQQLHEKLSHQQLGKTTPFFTPTALKYIIATALLPHHAYIITHAQNLPSVAYINVMFDVVIDYMQHSDVLKPLLPNHWKSPCNLSFTEGLICHE